MRILGKLVLDCDPDAAWRALHSPTVLGELYGPLLRVGSLEPGGFPARWESGQDGAVRMTAGPVPLGAHLISFNDRHARDSRGEVRIVRDAGLPLTGPLSWLDAWDHQMAVSPAPGDPARTLWRERLVFAGPTAALLWPALWTAWRVRESRLRRLARGWAFDPPDRAGVSAEDADASGPGTDEPGPDTDEPGPDTDEPGPDTGAADDAGAGPDAGEPGPGTDERPGGESAADAGRGTG